MTMRFALRRPARRGSGGSTPGGAVVAACAALAMFAATAIVAFAAAPDTTTKSARRRPNVVWIISDDHQHSAIHALGNEDVRTPHLDRLARRGFVFRNAYIMGSTVPAVCQPSRAMLFSGRSLWHVPLDLAETVSLPQGLRGRGYATFATGKWHNGPASFQRAFADGDAIFFGGMTDPFRTPVFDYDPAGRYPAARQRIAAKHSSELFADAAIALLRSHRGPEPFFLSLAFTSPHDPRDAPAPYDAMYDPDRLRVPPNLRAEHPFDNGELKIRDELLAPWLRTEKIVRRHMADYYGMISHMDAQIGRVLEAMERTGHADDTLVVFAGDNGLALGQHGLLGKQSVYEHSLRVPLIVAGAGVAPGRSDALVYLFDVLPTVCELIGAPPPDGIDGRSLAPVLRGRPTQGRDVILGAYKDFQRSIRDRRWKLIEYDVAGKRTTQLFDLLDDPWEMRDLSGDPQYAGQLAQLRRLLAETRRAAGDPKR